MPFRSFTGGVEGGKAVAVLAAKRLRSVDPMETSGHAATIALDDANLELLVSQISESIFGDAGRRCVSNRVLLVHKHFAQVVAHIKQRAEAIVMGDPMDPKTEMGPVITKKSREEIHYMVSETAKQIGREPLTGGQIDPRPGYFYPPTIFTNVPENAVAMKQEIFGPVLVINELQGKNREEALWNGIELVNKSRYGLSNALFTNDRRLSMLAKAHIKTGALHIDKAPHGSEGGKYFGGCKDSGWGYEGKGLDWCTRPMQFYDDYLDEVRPVPAEKIANAQKLISESKSPLEK